MSNQSGVKVWHVERNEYGDYDVTDYPGYCDKPVDDLPDEAELVLKSDYDKLKAENDSLRIELGKPYDKVDRLFESNKKLHQDLEAAKILIQSLKETLQWYGKDGEGPYSDARLYLKAQAALKEIEQWESRLTS